MFASVSAISVAEAGQIDVRHLRERGAGQEERQCEGEFMHDSACVAARSHIGQDARDRLRAGPLIVAATARGST